MWPNLVEEAGPACPKHMRAKVTVPNGALQKHSGKRVKTALSLLGACSITVAARIAPPIAPNPIVVIALVLVSCLFGLGSLVFAGLCLQPLPSPLPPFDDCPLPLGVLCLPLLLCPSPCHF